MTAAGQLSRSVGWRTVWGLAWALDARVEASGTWLASADAMNAIQRLKADHRAVEKLFEQAEGISDKRTKRETVQKIIRELSIHAAIEEAAVYPRARRIAGVKTRVLEGLEEHHVMKWLLNELASMSPDEERFDAKIKVLREATLRHIREEEAEVFPKLEKALSSQENAELGATIQRLRRVAPTRPHPRTPDTPPGNLVTGAGVAMLDWVRDVGRDLASQVSRRSRTAGRSSPKRTPRRKPGRVRAVKSSGAQSTKRTAKTAKRSRARPAT